MAFLTKVKFRGKNVRAIVWHDATRGAGRAGRRRAMCVGGDHTEALDAAELSPNERAALAGGARKTETRAALLKAYEKLELLRLRDAERTRAAGVSPAFDTTVGEFLDACEAYIAHRVSLDEGNPVPLQLDPGWRAASVGRAMRKRSAAEVKRTITRFRESLPAGLTTGSMTGEHLRVYLMAQRQAGRSVKYINNQRTYLSSLFSALTGRARKRLFRSDPLQWFRDDVEMLPESRRDVEVYDAATVIAFLEAAERRADPDREVTIKRRKKNSRKDEEYTARISADPAPVLQWALLLACTGMRRSEAETLRWTDVDLAHGVIRIRRQKTPTRHLPLIGDPIGDVAPGLVDVLKAWRADRPDDVYVLPSANGTPTYPTHGWQNTAESADVSVTPQGLRRTFESMLAMTGVPSGLAAFWLGHSVQVAEKHYRAYRPGRLPGATVDAALGMAPFLAREARGGATLRAIPPTKGA